MSAIVLYAPNVHVGGGFVLLSTLLANLFQGEIAEAYLDVRAQRRLLIPAGLQVRWVHPTLCARMRAEWALYRSRTAGPRTVLCFHGLPPLLDRVSTTVVFLQNRLYIDRASVESFPFRVKCRIAMERTLFHLGRHGIDRFVVQTGAMRRVLLAWYTQRGRTRVPPRVDVCAFTETLPVPDAERDAVPKRWDFVYVGDGQAHKNHRALVEAWGLLAAEGVTPTLVLTLGPEFARLIHEIEAAEKATGARIVNLGVVSRAEVSTLYASSQALIFPSLMESLGLPLVEAAHAKLPILAPELDYVREVCVPTETFDARSPSSIAHAVRRFLQCGKPPAPLSTPSEFMRVVRAGVPP